MPGFVKNVESLDVFQKAYKLSLHIHTLSLGFPSIEQNVLADQMRRASRSVCANLAEGFGKQRAKSKEFRRFVMMAIGSSDEMRVWLRYAIDLGYISQAAGQKLRDDYHAVSKMLQALYSAWEKSPITDH